MVLKFDIFVERPLAALPGQPKFASIHVHIQCALKVILVCLRCNPYYFCNLYNLCFIFRFYKIKCIHVLIDLARLLNVNKHSEANFPDSVDIHI